MIQHRTARWRGVSAVGLRLACWSLVALLPACNSAGGAEAVSTAASPSTAPATRPVWVAPATQPDFHVDPKQTLSFLASDELRGRLVGSPGIDRAADRIAGDFARLGLRPPPGQADYFQRFQTPYSVATDPKTSIAPGTGKDWTAGLGRPPALERDFVPIGFTGEGAFDAPIVFAGYGAADKEHGYDDYAGIDVGGRVVLAMRYEPHDAKGQSRFTGREDDWSPGAVLTEKAKQAAAHGAVALLLVTPPAYHDADSLAPFERYLMSRRLGIPVIQVTQPLADAILTAGGAGDLKSAQGKIDSFGKPGSVPLKDVTVRGNVTLSRPDAKNVVAVLPGTGPKADEYVVIGAHYDHLGRGVPGSLNFLLKAPHPSPHAGNGDPEKPDGSPSAKQAETPAAAQAAAPAAPQDDIHHGADDNASGTTAVLMLADRFAHAGPQARSLVFVTFTAEEEGLIGSKHFVDHSPVPLDKVVAMLNLDMVGRVSGDTLSVGGLGTAANFEQLVKEADKDLELKATPMGMLTGGKGGIGPSDHMSFALKKVPVLFFFTGMHKDYHRPTDTADKVNFAGLQEVVELGERVVQGLTRMPRQEYVSKYDSTTMARLASGSGNAGGGKGMGKATLGVVPDYGGESPVGVKISGTVPGSPAERAGLADGDILLKWNDQRIESLEGLTELLGRSKPGDKVRLVVQRAGKPVELNATLAERKIAHD